MKNFLFLPAAILLLSGAGCAAPQTTGVHEVATTSKGSQAAHTRVVFQGEEISVGDTTLSFKLYGKNGDELTSDDLNIAHEKLLHLIFVRDDMTGYQHLHPNYQDGTWAVATEIPEQGTYQVYVDIAPKNEDDLVLRQTLVVGNVTGRPIFPSPTKGLTTNVSGTVVTLEIHPSLIAKQEVELTFALTKDGKAIGEIKPYLGAYGHVITLRHGDPDVYLHAHALTTIPPTNGRVQFITTFPVPGDYTFYPQFNVANKIMTFPITVTVGNAAATSTIPTKGGH